MLLQMALFHSFNGWVLFYCVCRIYTYIHTCIPHLLYTFICRWTFSLCPCRSSGHSLSHVWLFDPMDWSTPGFPLYHQLPELPQTHAHQVSDAIQPSHPLSSPSPPAFNLSQPRGLFQWVSSSHQVTKLLELQLQHQSFQWIFRADFL